MMHLAEINIARLKHDADDPRVAPFFKALETVYGIAERSDGFAWRHADESGNATDTRVSDDARLIVNLSVWETVGALEHFVWNTVHKAFYRRRAEWFDVLDSMHFAMWWVEPGAQPTPQEAMARLAHYDTHGNTDHAFGWDHLTNNGIWRAERCAQPAAE